MIRRDVKAYKVELSGVTILEAYYCSVIQERASLVVGPTEDSTKQKVKIYGRANSAVIVGCTLDRKYKITSDPRKGAKYYVFDGELL